MNSQLTFEEDPWKRACSQMKEQDLGKAEQIIVQCICPSGTVNKMHKEWKQRVECLAGEAQSYDLYDCERAISGIGVFGEHQTIVRMFFDDGAQDICENFEIVTQKALLIWKPINTNQGHLMAENNYFIECRQAYVEDLSEASDSAEKTGGTL